VKVLYIAGPSRSGSTLLSNILGELDGFFNGGELIDVWDRALLRNGKCSCGRPFRQCEVWSRVIRTAFGDEPVDLQEMIRVRDEAARSRSVPRYLIAGGTGRLTPRLQPYLRNIQRLHEGIRSATGARVLVDASKNVGYAYLLSQAEKRELYYLHLVRDPRATAFSWRRKKEGLRTERPASVSLTWASRNLAGELLGRRHPSRYLRIRYEDFVLNAREMLSQILDMLGEPRDRLPFCGPHTVETSVRHSMYGNPDRFQSGRLQLKRDDQWKSKMAAVDRSTVFALTWPLLLRYGYPLVAKTAD